VNLVDADVEVMDVGTKRVQSPSASDTHVISGEPDNATVTPARTPFAVAPVRSPLTFMFNATVVDVGGMTCADATGVTNPTTAPAANANALSPAIHFFP